MVTLLAFNVKTKKSILKYFIAEENSNFTILDGKISWSRYLLGDRRAPLQNGRFSIVRSLRFKMAATVDVGTRYLNTQKTKPAHSTIAVNSSLIPFI